jgi:hypothetical protein
MSPSRSLLVADQLRLARAVPHYRGTVAKDVIGQVELDLVNSRFIIA